ncbi:MAG TPA: CvpA family protein [Cellvibrio sp.]|nr:CvpA family protein [Cellvibrio sp.]
MNWADWAIVVILTLSSVISLARGFIKEAFSLFIWVAALLAANLFSDSLEQLLVNTISTPSLRALTAFIAIFIIVLLLGALINYLIGMLVKASGLSGTDRLLGMVFGLVRGLFIILIALAYVPSFLPIKNDPWYQQSALIPYFAPYESGVKNIVSDFSHWISNAVGDKPREVKT